jgi:acyl-coenzyme A thioesterase PaaI-like protein
MTTEAGGTLLCGGCRDIGYCRLGIGAIETIGQQSAMAPARCAQSFHAGPRVAHGGWTAAVMDDMIGRSLNQMGARAVTATLNIEFVKPVPVEEDLDLKVAVESHEGRLWRASATLRLKGSNADLARGKGLWIERRPDHFERHEEALRAHRQQKREEG